MEEEIKIVVLGDPGVGKTSLILNIVTENFNTNPPKCLNRIGITNEIFANQSEQNYGMTYLIDYNEDHAETILRDADAVCLCHSIAETHDPEKLFESCEKWLSFVRLQAYKSPPVILVGTKSDKVSKEKSNLNDSWQKKCKDLMSRYPEVASTIECSAKLNFGVLDVFVSAQKCAIYPICPVFNARTGKLTAQASNAIKRIFNIADHNFNDVIEKTELCELQRLVFGSPLNDKGYEDIKSLILNNHNRGFTKRGIERDGFILLQAKLCSNLKQEVVWKMLKAFGYELKNGEIKIKDLSQDSVEFMDRKFVFTSDVIDFLTKVFRACDFEASGKLSQREMELLFRPIGNYPEEFELSYDMSPVNNHTNSYGDQTNYITLASFITRWHILLVKNPERCLELIFLLGFFQSQNGLQVNTTKFSNRNLVEKIIRKENNILNRNYVHAVVTGNKYIGKTTLLRMLMSDSDQLTSTFGSSGSTGFSNWVGKEIVDPEMLYTKTLILEERSLHDIHNLQCDCILICYSPSDPESLDALEKYADQLQQSIISIPLFLTRTRCDLNIRKNSFTNAQVNSFIMQWCSIHQELNFSGAKTPKVFYTHATKTILKHYGLAEPTLLQRYIIKYNVPLHYAQYASISIAACIAIGILLLKNRK